MPSFRVPPLPLLLLAGAILLAAAPAPARALTAEARATGFSLSVILSADPPLLTSLSLMSYDGSTDLPLGYPELEDGDLELVSNLEVSPTAPGSSVYRADYLLLEPLGGFEYGTLSATLPASDADGDGLLDVLEIDQPGGFTLSGTLTAHSPGEDGPVEEPLSLEMERAPGARRGTLMGSLPVPEPSSGYVGDFALGRMEGEVTYERGGTTLDWAITMESHVVGPGRPLSGTSSVVRSDEDSIAIPSFVLTDSKTDDTFVTRPMTLEREGDTYRGMLELEDGAAYTPWRDYTHYRIEVTDPNDVDEDGLPDLTTVPEPGAAASATAALVALLALRRAGAAAR